MAEFADQPKTWGDLPDGTVVRLDADRVYSVIRDVRGWIYLGTARRGGEGWIHALDPYAPNRPFDHATWTVLGTDPEPLSWDDLSVGCCWLHSRTRTAQQEASKDV